MFGRNRGANLRPLNINPINMKKHILLFGLIASFSTLFAQTPVLDSAVLGAGYANDVYYSMANGVVSTETGSNWHLAFAIRNAAPPTNVMRSTTILANEGRGVRVFESTQSISSWSNFDTAGYSTWSNPHNSDSTWDIGAFNVNRNESDPFDYGWGSYDLGTHDVAGAKIYLVRITTGSGPSAVNTFKKITINKIVFDSQWVFTYANLDNSDSMTVEFNKSQFAGKLFAYHNLLNDTTYDREPAAKWDLLFTRYGAYATQFGQTVFSTNTGALNHPNVLTSKVQGVPNDSAVAGNFVSKITTIGADWKINPGPGQPTFLMVDSLVYFVRAENGREDKLIFKSFAGSSTGSIVFEKTRTKFATGIAKATNSIDARVYPNPASTSFTIEVKNNATCVVNVYDITGKTQITTSVSAAQNTIDISTLHSGIYFVSIESNGAKTVARLIVQ